MMQRILIGVVIVMVTLSGGCSGYSHAFKAEAGFTLAAPAATVTTLKVDWRNGAVSVRGDASATAISASGTRYARAGLQSSADAALEDIELTLAADAADAGVLKLMFSAPPDGPVNYGGKVELVTPPHVALIVNSSNGKIVIENVASAATLETSNGQIQVLGHVGDVEARTSNGAVRVATAGDVNVHTSNGSVVIEGKAGNATARTSNGAIEITANPPAAGLVEARSSNGGVKISLPQSFGADVELDTSNGRITAELGGFAGVGNVDTKRTHARATINGGGGRVHAETSNGSIRLTSHADTE